MLLIILIKVPPVSRIPLNTLKADLLNAALPIGSPVAASISPSPLIPTDGLRLDALVLPAPKDN